MIRSWVTATAFVLAAGGASACGQARSLVAKAPTTTQSAGTTDRTPGTLPSTTDTTPTSVPQPPYQITESTLHLVDTSRPTISRGRLISRSRSLVTLLWLPDRPGKWPLIVFAHGFQVGPQPYAALLEAWAAHGYAVAAPEFPLTDADVAGPNLDEGDIDQQPADVRFVTDFLVSEPSPVASRIDAGEIAVAGHSDGAEAALAAAADPAPPGQPAYRAVVVFGAQPVTGDGGHNPPILVGQGDEDAINPPSYGYSVYSAAASPKYLMVMRGGGHLAPLEAGSTWLAGIERETEAFLDAYVARDSSVAAIEATAAGYPDLTVQSG